jgi:Flp pilus assembly pilin Flp
MSNETLRGEAAPQVSAASPDLETARGAIRTMWKDENGQAMVEFVIMVSVMVVAALIINTTFGELIEGRMRLTWEHIIYPCFLF